MIKMPGIFESVGYEAMAASKGGDNSNHTSRYLAEEAADKQNSRFAHYAAVQEKPYMGKVDIGDDAGRRLIDDRKPGELYQKPVKDMIKDSDKNIYAALLDYTFLN